MPKVDKYRYRYEYYLLLTIDKRFRKLCLNSTVNHSYILNSDEILFLNTLSKKISCEKLEYLLNYRIVNIFCMNIDNPKKLEKIAFYAFDGKYCTKSIYGFINFIEERYKLITIEHKKDYKKVNKILFDRYELIDENEAIDMILKMKLGEFIKKFSSSYTKETLGTGT